jgi:hypothetical protein
MQLVKIHPAGQAVDIARSVFFDKSAGQFLRRSNLRSSGGLQALKIDFGKNAAP